MILMVYFGCLKGEWVVEMFLVLVVLVVVVFLGKLVVLVDDCIGDIVVVVIDVMVDGDVLFLENICYYKGEEKNDLDFVYVFVENGDFYVNDVFFVVYCVYGFIEGLVKFVFVYVGWIM